jgi:hypothetical protein
MLGGNSGSEDGIEIPGVEQRRGFVFSLGISEVNDNIDSNHLSYSGVFPLAAAASFSLGPSTQRRRRVRFASVWE